MENTQKEGSNTVEKWQLAYIARDLRHKKTITLNCLRSEADMVLQELGTFSHSFPVSRKSDFQPDSRKIFLEITNAI